MRYERGDQLPWGPSKFFYMAAAWLAVLALIVGRVVITLSSLSQEVVDLLISGGFCVAAAFSFSLGRECSRWVQSASSSVSKERDGRSAATQAEDQTL